MSKSVVALGLMLATGSAWAQTPPSQAVLPGHTPPGTPAADSVPNQVSRDTAGQQVIGHTATPPGPVPGNTGGQATGAR